MHRFHRGVGAFLPGSTKKSHSASHLEGDTSCFWSYNASFATAAPAANPPKAHAYLDGQLGTNGLVV